MPIKSTQSGMLSRPVLVVCANPALEITFPIENRWGRFSSCHRATWEPAGKGTTVARILGALRVPSFLIGLSGGYVGQYLKRRLTDEGIRFELIDLLPETRCSVAMVDQFGKASILREDGPRVPRHGHAQLLNLAARHLRNASCLCVSGSLPTGLRRSLYSDLCNLATSAGKLAFLDCSGPVLLAALKRKPFLVKINREEAEATLGQSVDSNLAGMRALRAFTELGARNVLISLGKDGAVALIEHQLYRIMVPNIPIRSSVGAGDALMAGLLWAYGREVSWSQRLKLAMGVALSSTRFLSSGHIATSFSAAAECVRVTETRAERAKHKCVMVAGH